MRYVRAEKVLPPELLKEVQKHHTGLIYVPGDPAFYEKRDEEIIRLRRQGLPTEEIAERVYLCPRRIRQIIRRRAEQERTQPASPCGPSGHGGSRGGSARGNPR